MRLPRLLARQKRPSTDVVVAPATKASSVPDNLLSFNSLNSVIGGWWPRVWESFTGAWQSNVVVDQAQVAANWAVFSCVTLIAGDIGKMPARVMQFDAVQQVWLQTLNRPVLRKPNDFQTWPDFVHSWIFSLLLRGNTYVLKQRDKNGFVVALYVLDPNLCTPLVANDGSVFYQIGSDFLSEVPKPLGAVPASEIIHDRINTLYHPLVGLSPIFANGIAAMQGLSIQNNSAKFFQNMSRPSGVLTAPGPIDIDKAMELKKLFEANFSAESLGRLFVVGDGLKYEPVSISAEDSQMIEQLKFTGEMVCATFHVPPYKLGLGPMPTVNNTASLNQQYYDQCLHPIVDNIERRLDDGLELFFPFEVWFDTTELLRMDPSTRYEAQQKRIQSGSLSPNEARRDENMPPVKGGETPFLQQQMWPLDKLAERDAVPPEPAPPTAAATADTPPPAKAAEPDEIKSWALVSLKAKLADANAKKPNAEDGARALRALVDEILEAA